MNTEAQRIAIAEACGYSNFYQGTHGGDLVADYTDPATGQEYRGYCSRVPHYTTDLNAIHDVENTLTPAQRDRYILILGPIANFGGVPMSWSLLHATAAQRAEAFLRTIGKWSENPA